MRRSLIILNMKGGREGTGTTTKIEVGVEDITTLLFLKEGVRATFLIEKEP